MNPIIKHLAKERGENLRLVKIDIDKNQQLANQLGIRGVPTFMLYKDGKSVWRQSGALTKSAIEAILDEHNIT